jgi:competence protein ComEC
MWRAAVRGSSSHGWRGAKEFAMSVSEIVARPGQGRAEHRISPVHTSVAAVLPKVSLIVHYQPLLIVLGAVCAGIVADRYVSEVLPLSFEMWWLVAAGALVAWLMFWLRRAPWWSMGAVLMAVLALGGAWHHYCWNLFGEDELGLAATETPQPICVEGIAVSAPEEAPAPAFDPLRSLPSGVMTRLLVDAVAVRDGAQWRTASGQAQVAVEGELSGVHVGDRLRIFGLLEAPLPAGNPGEFDTAEFDRSKRELCLIRVKQPMCLTVTEAGSKWERARWISEIRQAGDRLLWSYLSKERAGMAGAVLLGEREEVDHETSEAFLETGSIHILCIAGLHIGILAGVLFVIFRAGWLSRRTALLCVM